MTVIGWGYSAINDACAATLDLEVWGTGTDQDDGSIIPLTLATNGSTIAAGLDGSPQSADDANLDVLGDQYILWGIDNNCGGTIVDWNFILYVKWRHDQP